jgi:hypothetical protein
MKTIFFIIDSVGIFFTHDMWQIRGVNGGGPGSVPRLGGVCCHRRCSRGYQVFILKFCSLSFSAFLHFFRVNIFGIYCFCLLV